MLTSLRLIVLFIVSSLSFCSVAATVEPFLIDATVANAPFSQTDLENIVDKSVAGLNNEKIKVAQKEVKKLLQAIIPISTISSVSTFSKNPSGNITQSINAYVPDSSTANTLANIIVNKIKAFFQPLLNLNSASDLTDFENALKTMFEKIPGVGQLPSKLEDMKNDLRSLIAEGNVELAEMLVAITDFEQRIIETHKAVNNRQPYFYEESGDGTMYLLGGADKDKIAITVSLREAGGFYLSMNYATPANINALSKIINSSPDSMIFLLKNCPNSISEVKNLLVQNPKININQKVFNGFSSNLDFKRDFARRVLMTGGI